MRGRNIEMRGALENVNDQSEDHMGAEQGGISAKAVLLIPWISR